MQAQTDPVTGMISYSVGSFLPEDNVALGTPGAYDPEIVPAAIELMHLVMGELRQHFARFRRAAGAADGAEGFSRTGSATTPTRTGSPQPPPSSWNPCSRRCWRARRATRWAPPNTFEGWHEILQVIYPDFFQTPTNDFLRRDGEEGPGLHSREPDPGLRGRAHGAGPARGDETRLGLREDKLIAHGPTDTSVEGTGGDDWIYLTGGDQTYRGGPGADIYFVGANFGHDIIDDVEKALADKPAVDELRFTTYTEDEVTARIDGLDLVFEVIATGDTLRVPRPVPRRPDRPALRLQLRRRYRRRVHHVGRWQLLELVGSRLCREQGGRCGRRGCWARNPRDVLQGGKGNDVLRGGRDGDIYSSREG